MSQARVLVAGIGNIFLGDDGFGCEVARRLAGRGLPEAVRVVDFGIRGFDLAYALLDNYELAILVDAAPRGGVPGTLYVIEPDLGELDEPAGQDVLMETHGMNPLRVLGLVKELGGEPKRIVVVGCEPATTGPEEGAVGLSEPVRAAVGEAVTIVDSLIAQVLSPGAGESRVESTA
jgi:hydrogenase maturation protease